MALALVPSRVDVKGYDAAASPGFKIDSRGRKP